MPPKRLIRYALLASMFFCSSCISSSYFHSPLQGNTAVYHTIPVASDSIKSATYINAGISIGSMNSQLRDMVFSLQGGVHRSHVLNHIRLNYGASLALGSYNIKPFFDYNSAYNFYLDSSLSGTKFFGAYGAYGGISAATALGRRVEWRYIGLEGSIFNEFGSYYAFRAKLPDSSADEIDRKRYLGTVGLNTELVFKGRSQNKFGVKLAVGTYLRRLQNHSQYNAFSYRQYDNLWWLSNTYHFTIKKHTAFFQFNAATHAVHFLMGYNYRL